ncbi:MAG: transglycosylase SLT domain-containing protein [Bacteroidetes bacterium]|nr:transglycosylase SLT domain-containing protein [Bacteroidota bacterium]MCL5268580.1 transglycosylase SLT domain-containing protein [Bacteroidota bacterium]
MRQRMEQTFYVELSDAQIILDLKRSTEYFPYIDQKLRDMNLPRDLRYLPVAESALRNLVSYRGAAGIWQFTPETARHYGLIVNSYVDERYNFRKATDAALTYLTDLDSTFGSWSLAVAAYNMGSAGIKSSLNYQMVKSYYSLYLNDETAHFVFRIVALKQIMSHYKKYGFELQPSDFYHPPETKLVVITHIYNIAAWAKQQGSSYKELRELNPWLINRSLPEGTWAIQLPKYAQPAVFTESSPVIEDTTDSLTSNEITKSPLIYRVKTGDSLTRIADAYGVTVSDLVGWNDLGVRRYLKIGERLKIFLDNRDIEK